MNKLLVKDFSLFHTLDSGQFFLFEKIDSDNTYEIINGQTKFRIKQKNEILFYEGLSGDEIISFFNLNEDLNDLRLDEKDEYLLLSLEKYWGLRLINADLWQTIIGFIISSNNNISRIKNSMKSIVEEFGKNRTFPRPGEIDDEVKLKEICKVGYRAKFIYKTNEIVKENPNLLSEIEKADYETAKELLKQFPGIADKVADCVCLFSLGHNKAFPIDTWVKQIIEKIYLKREAKNIKEIEDCIKKNFTKGNIGLKQQYIFHYSRYHLKK